MSSRVIFAALHGGLACFTAPSSPSGEAIEGGVAEQIGPVEKEAGVRKQLRIPGGARGHQLPG